MNVKSLLAVMSKGAARGDVELVLESFADLNRISTIADLQALVTALQSDQSNFWLRELLSGPIARIGGSGCLPILLDAVVKGENEGHDNDLLCSNLIEMAAAHPTACREVLNAMIQASEYQHKEVATWLLDYCS